MLYSVYVKPQSPYCCIDEIKGLSIFPVIRSISYPVSPPLQVATPCPRPSAPMIKVGSSMKRNPWIIPRSPRGISLALAPWVDTSLTPSSQGESQDPVGMLLHGVFLMMYETWLLYSLFSVVGLHFISFIKMWAYFKGTYLCEKQWLYRNHSKGGNYEGSFQFLFRL